MQAFAALLLLQAPVGGFAPEKHPVSPDNVRAVCDIPSSQHIRNTGGSDGRRGPGSGSGLCVFTSIEVAGDWQQLPELAGFQKWMMHRPGGGYPTKVDAMLKAYCKEKGVPVPPYMQHTAGDDTILDLAIKTGRMPCITYAGRDDFYRGGIAHMVNLVHLDKERACIVDNNRPGTFLWMSRAELLSRWRSMDGGWFFVWLASPPPPYNGTPVMAFEEPANFGIVMGQVHDEPKGQGPDGNNFGVDTAKVHDGRRFSLTGVEVTEAEAKAALLDDSNRINVTMVGDAASHKVLTGVVAALPDTVTNRLHVQSYGPTAWEASQFGLPVGLTVRSVAVNRIGKDLTVLDANASQSADAVRVAILESLDGPKPLPPAPVPTPEPAPNPAPTPAPPPNGTPWYWVVLTGLASLLAGILAGRARRTTLAVLAIGCAVSQASATDLQAPVADEHRALNKTGVQCVWASLETLGKRDGVPAVSNMTSEKFGPSGPAEVESVLRAKGVTYDMVQPGNLDATHTFLEKHVAAGRPCAIGVYAGRHCLLCVHFERNKKVVTLGNAAVNGGIREWTWNEFLGVMQPDGWAFCLTGKPAKTDKDWERLGRGESISVRDIRLTGYGVKDMLEINRPMDDSRVGLLITSAHRITLSGKPTTVCEVHAKYKGMVYPWLRLSWQESDNSYHFEEATYKPAKAKPAACPCPDGKCKCDPCKCGPKGDPTCPCKDDCCPKPKKDTPKVVMPNVTVERSGLTVQVYRHDRPEKKFILPADASKELIHACCQLLDPDTYGPLVIPMTFKVVEPATMPTRPQYVPACPNGRCQPSR